MLGCRRIRADDGLPIQDLGLPTLGEYDPFQRQLSFKQIDADEVAVQYDGAKTICRAEEAFEGTSLQLGTNPESPVHGRIAKTGQSREQRVARHGAGVVVAALVFVPRVAYLPVIPASQSLPRSDAKQPDIQCQSILHRNKRMAKSVCHPAARSTTASLVHDPSHNRDVAHWRAD